MPAWPFTMPNPAASPWATPRLAAGYVGPTIFARLGVQTLSVHSREARAGIVMPEDVARALSLQGLALHSPLT